VLCFIFTYLLITRSHYAADLLDMQLKGVIVRRFYVWVTLKWYGICSFTPHRSASQYFGRWNFSVSSSQPGVLFIACTLISCKQYADVNAVSHAIYPNSW